MKLVTLLLVTWLALASCHLSFLGKFEQPEDSGKNKDNFITFLEGVFSYFNLPSPSQIDKCFCEVNSGMYFNLLQEIGEVLKDTKDRSSLELHLEYGKILILLHSLKDTHACMFLTQDFTDLLNALDIGERNPSVFANYAYIFYQAHYIDLFEGFKPVLYNLNTQSNKEAGRAFGAVLKNTVTSIKEEGLGHIVFTAFGNGGAIALDIDEPDDSLQCYDNDASGLLMEFIYKLCDAVANGDWREGALNAMKFMHAEGKDILSKIPQEDYECQLKSQDTQEFSKAVGIDITSMEFHDRLLRYIFDNRLHYYTIRKNIKAAFEKRNLHHAGSIYYRFLKKAASAK